QDHMGCHILHSMRGTNVGREFKVTLDYPCGFCGQATGSSQGTCQVKIVGGCASSECSLSYRFRVSSASKVSVSKPCTNVPIACPLSGCGEIHWKYNFTHHLQDRHPNWRNTLAEPTLKTLASRITISQEEEVAIGIPDNI
ncbi:hypothetical protein K474DRAFT_1558418, partial [Panus rudis PR-1116 ss-1]